MPNDCARFSSRVPGPGRTGFKKGRERKKIYCARKARHSIDSARPNRDKLTDLFFSKNKWVPKGKGVVIKRGPLQGSLVIQTRAGLSSA